MTSVTIPHEGHPNLAYVVANVDILCSTVQFRERETFTVAEAKAGSPYVIGDNVLPDNVPS